MRAPLPGFALGSCGVLALVGAAVLSLSRASRPPADLAFSNGSEIASLDPHAVTGIPEGRVLRALYEGLTVKHPRTLEPLPGMAEHWEVSDDGRRWRFAVRAGSFWTNGDEVSAHDFEFAWKRLLDPRTGAEYQSLLFPIAGAEDFARDVDERGAPRRSSDTVAIRALDARTLEVELARPFDALLALTSSVPLFPLNRRAIEALARDPGAWTSPERVVTNGPFALVERRLGDRLRLARHEGYWDVEHVALRTLDVLASEALNTNLNLYLTGAIGYLDEVPPASIAHLRGREDFRPEPYLGTSFLRIDVTEPPFDDPRVRRALALAIDRRAIVDKVTRGGELPTFSLVPSFLPGWKAVEMRRAEGADEVERLQRDVAEARALLASAGFGPQGRAFPTFELFFASQAANRDVCEVLADGWRTHLGLDVRLRTQEWKVFLASQRALDYDVSRSSWIADYADPATFLDVFRGASESNRTGWSDERYDALLARAELVRGGERIALLREAEAVLLEALPIVPVYTFAVTNLVDPRLGGFEPNALDEHFPKHWYWRDDAELEAARAALPPGVRRVVSHGPAHGLYARSR